MFDFERRLQFVDVDDLDIVAADFDGQRDLIVGPVVGLVVRITLTVALTTDLDVRQFHDQSAVVHTLHVQTGQHLDGGELLFHVPDAGDQPAVVLVNVFDASLPSSDRNAQTSD